MIKTTLFKLLLAGLVALLLVSGYKNFVRMQRETGRTEQKAVDQKAVDQIKAAGRAKYDELLQDWLAQAKALRILKDQQEVKDAQAKQFNADMEKRLRAVAAANGGRLRDPAADAGGRGRGGGGAETGAASTPGCGGNDATETKGLLSKPLTELLLTLTSEADAINTAYASCRADAYHVRGLVVPGDENP